MNDITALAQRMKAAAEKASNGAWVKESGDGWEASCSANDQANGGFIIAQFEGPDAAANREFVQAANPANVMALVEALESRTTTVKWPMPKETTQGWKIDPEFICKVQGVIGYEEEYGIPSMEVVEAVLLAAAGIQVIEGEGQHGGNCE